MLLFLCIATAKLILCNLLCLYLYLCSYVNMSFGSVSMAYIVRLVTFCGGIYSRLIECLIITLLPVLGRQVVWKWGWYISELVQSCINPLLPSHVGEAVPSFYIGVGVTAVVILCMVATLTVWFIVFIVYRR